MVRHSKKPIDFVVFVTKSLVVGALGGAIFGLMVLAISRRFDDVPIVFTITTLFFGLGIVADYTWRTRDRSNDPYRFARKQVRNASVERSGSLDRTIKNALSQTEFKILDEEVSKESILIKAYRDEFSDTKRYPKSKVHQTQYMEIAAKRATNTWKVTVSCQPNGKNNLVDYSLTTYNCLEEILPLIEEK